MPEYSEKFAAGEPHTSQCSADVTAGRVLVVSGSGTVAHSAGANKAVCGVSAHDAKSGEKVAVLHGGVQRLVAGSGGVTAGDVLESATAGGVVTHTEGTNDSRILGVALTTATATNIVEVLFLR